MMMYRRFLIFCCKVLIRLLRLVGKNGSALPGLIIERLNPRFLETTLKDVEKKILLVTGTNGKTTTTKMLVTALRGTGARVVTNATGSNMTRGLIAALVEDMTYLGSLKPTDWFVFEMDEAYAPIFTRTISPRALLALNVLRDQLDRYGEIDTTARFIGQAAQRSDMYIYNQLDPLLINIAGELDTHITTASFGVSEALRSHVENEQTLHGEHTFDAHEKPKVELVAYDDSQDIQEIAVRIGGKKYILRAPVSGFHNALNMTAVAGLLYALDPQYITKGADALAKMPTPFGRGERLHLNGKNVTVALVKNPSGFMSNLETFVKQAKPQAVLFVVNDKIADGRDVSWLWDVDFNPFITDETRLFTSGIRAYDMALRLKHDNFVVSSTTNVSKAVASLMRGSHVDIVIIPTYTALFEVRQELAKYGKVAKIW